MTKHIFFVHSATCIECMYGIMRSNSILDSDVVVIAARGVSIPDMPVVLEYPDNWYHFPFFTHKFLWNLSWLNTRRYIEYIDRYIDYLCDDNFIFYAQNGRHYMYRAFITNKKCLGVEYFEDGVDFYFTAEMFNIKYPSPLKVRYKIVNYLLSSLLRVGQRVLQDDLVFPNKQSQPGKVYVLSPKSTHYFRLYFSEIELINPISASIFHDIAFKTVLCMSALEEQRIAPNNHVLDVYISWLRAEGINEVSLKFHPAQSNVTRDYVGTRLITAGLEVDIIDDNVRMEGIFKSFGTDFKVVGCGSSLLNYALENSKDCQVYALYERIETKTGLTPRSRQWRNSFSHITNKRFKIVK